MTQMNVETERRNINLSTNFSGREYAKSVINHSAANMIGSISSFFYAKKEKKRESNKNHSTIASFASARFSSSITAHVQ